MLYREITKTKEPAILMITPLKPGDKVSRDTRVSLKRNEMQCDWITYTSAANPAKNTQLGYDAYKMKHGGVPPFVIKIDNDIKASRNMIDNMAQTLFENSVKSNGIHAYSYCGFEFRGAINHKFPLQPFDFQKLLKGNYISFNSLISTQCLEHAGGFVTDDKYFRLLDWALWLKFLSMNMLGCPVKDAYFVAQASENSVSARSDEDYKKRHDLIVEDFVNPLLERINETIRKNKELKTNDKV